MSALTLTGIKEELTRRPPKTAPTITPANFPPVSFFVLPALSCALPPVPELDVGEAVPELEVLL